MTIEVQAHHSQRNVSGVVVHTYVGIERVPEALRQLQIDAEGGPTWLREVREHGYVYICENCGELHIRGEHNECTCDVCGARKVLRELRERFSEDAEETTYSFNRKKGLSKAEYERRVGKMQEELHADSYAHLTAKELNDQIKLAYQRTLRNLYVIARRTPQDRLQTLLRELRHRKQRYQELAAAATPGLRNGYEYNEQAKQMVRAYEAACDMVWARIHENRDPKPRRKHKEKPQTWGTLQFATYHKGECGCGYDGHWS